MTAQQPVADERKELVPGTFKITKGEHIKTTLAEHGRNLLIGRTHGSFRFQPIDLPYRAMIGKLVNADPFLEDRVGERVVRTIALSLTEFGGLKWDDMTLQAKVTEVAKLHVSDIMYLSFVRLAEEYPDGWERPLPFPACPHCKKPLPSRVCMDLRQLYCEGWTERPEALYRLEKPWHLHGTLVKEVTLTSPRVATAMQPLTDDEFDNDLTRNMAWLASSMIAVNGQPRAMDRDQLLLRDATTGRGMNERDYNGMTACMEQLVAGPARYLVWKHEECKGEIPVVMAWGVGFFGASGA